MLEVVNNIEDSKKITIKQNQENINHLIVNADEIILWLSYHQLKINKYKNISSEDTLKTSYLYNESYFNYEETEDTYAYSGDTYFKGDNKVYHVREQIQVDERYLEQKEAKTEILTRKEIEDVFHYKNYDSIYVLCEGNVLYAYNKVDGFVVDKKIIPSDRQIAKLEWESRKAINNVDYSVLGKKFQEKESIKIKKIKNIKNFTLYGGCLGMFNQFIHTLITTKDGQFQIKKFGIEFEQKDVFKFSYKEVPFKEATVDTVISYMDKEKKQVKSIQNPFSNKK